MMAAKQKYKLVELKLNDRLLGFLYGFSAGSGLTIDEIVQRAIRLKLAEWKKAEKAEKAKSKKRTKP